MNYNQNQRLNQLDENILIIGVDVSKKFHVARAQDFRGVEFKRGIKFDNSRQGFAEFEEWKNSLQRENQKNKVLVGMEPTGPYWLPLARWLQTEGYWTVTVNPAHVKKSKELDDNNQAKTDYRDARVIAQLLKDARFSEPNLLEGIYEELRNAKNIRKVMVNDLKRIKNQMANWLDRYFPEYKKGYANWEAESFLYILDKYKLPANMADLNAVEVYSDVRMKFPRGVGQKKIEKLIEASKESIGITEGCRMAEKELDYLVKRYKELVSDIGDIEGSIEVLCEELPEVQKITQIKGIGITTASGVVAELGNIKGYRTPKQMIKMAGLSLTENSSGQKKGKMSISKRGRKDLRKILYQAVVGMIRTNEAFHELYQYYRFRAKNQLSGKQAIIVLVNKLLRIIHTIVVKNIDYDEAKMLGSIKHPDEFLFAA
jgi:transposase